MFKKIHHFFHHHYHTRYHGVYKHAKQLFVFDLILMGLTIAVLASGLFFYFWKPGITDLIDIKVTLDEKRIRSGEEVELSAKYTNRSKFKLNSPTLAIHLPDGFIIDREKTPENIFSKNSIATLPVLEPGAKGEIKIYGKYWTEPNNDEKIIGTLSYTPENSKRLEQKLTAFITHIPSSVLESKLELSSSTFPNQPLTFLYTLTNTSNSNLERLTITNNWNTSITTNTKALENFTLKAGEIKTVSGTIFAPEKAGDYSLALKSDIFINGKNITQTNNEKHFSVLAPELESSVRILKEKNFAEPNDVIPIEIKWKNNSTFRLSSLRLKIDFTPGVVDIAQIAKDNNFKFEGSTLLIDKDMRTALANGNPGSEDTFTISLKLLPSFKISGSEKVSLEVKPILEARTEQISDQIFNMNGKSDKIPLASEVKMTSEVRYFTAEGDQIGRGPIPPRVGEPTKYWIFVYIFNTTNPLSNAEFKLTLPSGVSFTGKQSVTLGETLKVTNGEVVWNNPLIPANSRVGLYFEVSVTPSPAQIGKTLLLSNGATFEAKDDFVNKTIEVKKSGLNNVLSSNDRGAKFGAKVVGN